MKLSHFFVPHSQTHQKAHLLSFKAFAVYILLFLVINLGVSNLGDRNGAILGVSTSIDQQELIRLTNVEREKLGLAPLRENTELNQAAYLKAQNMFQEDYWAHYSPSGKDPWGFIRGAGYNFTYAGENLARNFNSSPDVVVAWMGSPTHKENIVNSHYQEIGIAVVEGTLQGQPTTLVVQEFGTPVEYIAQSAPVATAVPSAVSTSLPSQQPSSLPTVAPTTQPLAQASIPAPVLAEQTTNLDQNKTLISPFQVSKNLALMLFGFIAFLILLDLYIVRRRLVNRFASSHLAHFSMMSVATVALVNSNPGEITAQAISIVQIIK